MGRDPKKNASFVKEVAAAYGSQLHRYLTRRLRSRQDAADLAQEVYLRLLRLKRTELIREPVAYVYYIASQIVGEKRLRDAQTRTVFDSRLADTLSEQGNLATAADDLHEQEYARRRLMTLLAKLSATHRAIWLLRKRDGLSTLEIAEQLPMSHFKVKRYLVEANAILESKLRDER